jgi:hypothetical protein
VFSFCLLSYFGILVCYYFSSVDFFFLLYMCNNRSDISYILVLLFDHVFVYARCNSFNIQRNMLRLLLITDIYVDVAYLRDNFIVIHLVYVDFFHNILMSYVTMYVLRNIVLTSHKRKICLNFFSNRNYSVAM